MDLEHSKHDTEIHPSQSSQHSTPGVDSSAGDPNQARPEAELSETQSKTLQAQVHSSKIELSQGQSSKKTAGPQYVHVRPRKSVSFAQVKHSPSNILPAQLHPPEIESSNIHTKTSQVQAQHCRTMGGAQDRNNQPILGGQGLPSDTTSRKARRSKPQPEDYIPTFLSFMKTGPPSTQELAVRRIMRINEMTPEERRMFNERTTRFGKNQGNMAELKVTLQHVASSWEVERDSKLYRDTEDIKERLRFRSSPV